MVKKPVHQGIAKVAVIGAGVMGAGIAAQVANAGVPVILLDVVPDGAAKAIEKLKKSNPAALMHVKNAALITPGSSVTDLKWVADCDWIIEAVIEKLEVKQTLYQQLNKHLKPGAVVSSNTSTIRLDVLMHGLPEAFAKRFLIAHFFNPPRYLRLLELVVGPNTAREAADKVRDFADRMLGKTVLDCADKPGFIGNRIGTYWMHAAVVRALEHGIGIETADALLGKPMGVPKTCVFGLMDLVGLDLMPHVLNSMRGALPETDAFVKLGPAPALLEKMIAEGYTGRKGKGGFYRLDENKNKLAVKLTTGEYRPARKVMPDAVKASKKRGLRALVDHDSVEGRYAWDVIGGMLAYAASLLGEIAADIPTIDAAMRLGFNWKYGPFQLIDQLGAEWFAERLKEEGKAVPKVVQLVGAGKFYKVKDGVLHAFTLKGDYKPVTRPEGVLLLEDVKRRSKRLFGNISASVWDVGDGVACFEFHSKMNTLNPLILMLLRKTLRELPKRGFKGLVVYNEGSNFSVGANVMLLLIGEKLRLWKVIDWILRDGQNTYAMMKYAPFPIVSAPAGMALGGGCEIILHSHAVEAHAETYTGLVEVGVGIIPGWGGCKELLGRALSLGKPGGPMPGVARTFETIATAKVSRSAAEAKELLFFRPTDGIVMNRDRLLAAAKARVLAMVPGFQPPAPHTYVLPGPSGLAAMKLALHDFAKKGLATPHDVVVGTELARTISGGTADVLDTLTEEDLLRLEREAFLRLVKTKGSQDRIAYILKHGKPLRN